LLLLIVNESLVLFLLKDTIS